MTFEHGLGIRFPLWGQEETPPQAPSFYILRDTRHELPGVGVNVPQVSTEYGSEVAYRNLPEEPWPGSQTLPTARDYYTDTPSYRGPRYPNRPNRPMRALDGAESHFRPAGQSSLSAKMGQTIAYGDVIRWAPIGIAFESAAVIGGAVIGETSKGWWKLLGYGLTSLGAAGLMSRIVEDWAAIAIPAVYFILRGGVFAIERLAKKSVDTAPVRARS